MSAAPAIALPGRATVAPASPDRVDPLRIVAFLAMCFGMFMAFLDIQVVSASLAEIQAGALPHRATRSPGCKRRI